MDLELSQSSPKAPGQARTLPNHAGHPVSSSLSVSPSTALLAALAPSEIGNRPSDEDLRSARNHENSTNIDLELSQSPQRPLDQSANQLPNHAGQPLSSSQGVSIITPQVDALAPSEIGKSPSEPTRGSSVFLRNSTPSDCEMTKHSPKAPILSEKCLSVCSDSLPSSRGISSNTEKVSLLSPDANRFSRSEPIASVKSRNYTSDDHEMSRSPPKAPVPSEKLQDTCGNALNATLSILDTTDQIASVPRGEIAISPSETILRSIENYENSTSGVMICFKTLRRPPQLGTSIKTILVLFL